MIGKLRIWENLVFGPAPLLRETHHIVQLAVRIIRGNGVSTAWGDFLPLYLRILDGIAVRSGVEVPYQKGRGGGILSENGGVDGSYVLGGQISSLQREMSGNHPDYSP